MKSKIFIIIAVCIFAGFPLKAQAAEMNFPAGSLIIPMDAFYQPDADGGILEAYGLAYYLLKHQTDGQHDITVYWIINQEKTTIDGVDLMINDQTLPAGSAVAKHYDHDGTTSALTFKTGDSSNKITYSGAPFVVSGLDAAKAKAIIDQVNWTAVDVHEAQVPFAAMVYREMRGTPPRIALMNNTETHDGGNAEILESYLRLAGICTDVYDVVTPCEIRNGILTSGDGYDFLWAPHWDGYKNYDNDDDNCSPDADSVPEVDEIVLKIKEFLANKKGLLAECASIEVFEHSPNGLFLSTKGFGHNGGTNDQNDIIYNDVISPNPQAGNFTYKPEGGHLHNWRPFQAGDDSLLPLPDVSAGNSTYRDTVTRYTIDNTGWDYYIGGYAYGDPNNGYVVYLGGHAYAKCKDKGGVTDPDPNVHLMSFEFDKNLSNESITLLVKYNSGSETTVAFNVNVKPFTAIVGDPLEIDLTTASVKDKKLNDVTFRNKGSSPITVNSITFTWTGGDASQKIKKITNEFLDEKIYDEKQASGTELDVVDFTISAPVSYASAGCTDNSDCSWKNIAGVRYLLNTLFNIKFQIVSYEYVRSAPISSHPYLYQGTFEYPSYEGHFRRFDVTADAYDPDDADWDTAIGGILAADSRAIYTAEKDAFGDWPKFAFSTANMAKLRTPLDVTPLNGTDTDEEAVIHRVRGKYWDPDSGASGAWLDRSNRLSGIMHSAPVIVDTSSRTGTRAEMAYVGDLQGMLHAIETATGHEKWAYIPRAVLGKLKNDRTDENAPNDFAAVDGSPTAVDVYYDPPNVFGTDKNWRTILASTGGAGGKYLFALDITDPTDWSVLWEFTGETILSYTGGGGFSVGNTVTGATSGATGVVVEDDTANDDLTVKDVVGTFKDGEVVSNATSSVTVHKTIEMGSASRCSIGKVKWPVRDVADSDSDGNTDEIIGYEGKYVVFVSTGFADITEQHGGINVYAIDLQTGERLWYFSEAYADSVNDIPGAVTLYDTNGDNFMDRVFVGDMNGRLWELEAVTGANPNGTETVAGVVKQIPLWNAGVGNPISVSPSIIKVNPGIVLVIFGTGGADWAADDKKYNIYAINATNKSTSPQYVYGAGSLYWKFELDAGEKVWSTPTIFNDQVFFATSTGSLESADPRMDIASGTGKLRTLNLGDGSLSGSVINIGKVRGSIYVDRGQVYLTTIDNTITRFGDGNFSPNAVGVDLKAWRHLTQ